MSAVTDGDLLARQAALQEHGRDLLVRLNLDALVADVGPLLVTGSFVSGLMSWVRTLAEFAAWLDRRGRGDAG